MALLKNYSPGSAYVLPYHLRATMRPAQWDALERLEADEWTPQDRYWADPASIMADADAEKPADPWQARLLESNERNLLSLCARQVGKSLSAGALALMTALREPGSLTLLLSPTARQSEELLGAKILPLYRGIMANHPAYLEGGGELVRELVRTLEFANGSRIIALPENPDGIVGYSSVSLLVIDEASRVSDELYFVVRPMLAMSEGRIICLSTPKGKRGFFFTEFEKGENWRRFSVTANECPRYSQEFLAEERQKMGERWFFQEYFNAFNDAVDAVFSQADLDAAESKAVVPLDLGL